MSAQGQGVTSAEALPTPKVWDVHLHPRLAVGGPGRGVRTTPVMFLNTPPWKTGVQGSGTRASSNPSSHRAVPGLHSPALARFCFSNAGSPLPPALPAAIPTPAPASSSTRSRGSRLDRDLSQGPPWPSTAKSPSNGSPRLSTCRSG